MNVVGPPPTFAAWSALVAHETVKAPAATSTGSVKVIEIVDSTGISPAPSAGVVLATAGAESPTAPHGDAELCGSLGEISWKSALLSSVSFGLPAASRFRS